MYRSLIAILLVGLLAGCTAPEGELREVAPPAVQVTTSPSSPTPTATTTTTATQTASCLANQAREWRTSVLEDDTPRFTVSIKGTDEGTPLDFSLAFDETQDYSYTVDSQEETTVQSRGVDVFITSEGTTSNYRQVGSQSYADWLMEDDGSEAPEWFSEPSAKFTPTCGSHAGSAAYYLTYFTPTIAEEWLFTSAGTLVSAKYVDREKSTNLQMTFSPTATIRTNPVGTKASFIEYSIISEGETSDGWYQNLRVEGGTFFEYYSQIDVDLYSGETALAELKPSNGYTSDYGSVEFLDEGQAGILDTGDLIQLTAKNPVDAYYLYNAWSETYFEESVLDAPAPEESTDPEAGETIAKHFEWTYQGDAYEWDMDIPVGILDYYASLPSRTSVAGRYGSVQAQYVTSSLDDEYIQGLADGMLEFGRGEGFSDDEILSMTLAFVQSLEYTYDSVSSPYDEYPRYPLETLAEDGGDCEDTSILFASLSLAMGYDTVLLNPPGHIAAGVAAEASVPGGGYMYQGKKYLFAETTGEGYEFGDVPTNYRTASAKILSLDPGPAIVIEDLTHQVENGYYHVVLTFSNDGSGATSSGRATVYGFNDARSYYYDNDYCAFDNLAAGTQYTCDLYLRISSNIKRIEAVIQTDDGLYARTY